MRLKAVSWLLFPVVDTGFMFERNITENRTHTIIYLNKDLKGNSKKKVHNGSENSENQKKYRVV